MARNMQTYKFAVGFIVCAVIALAILIPLLLLCRYERIDEAAYGQEAVLNWSGPTFTILQIADSQIHDVVYDRCQNTYSDFCNASNTTAFISRLLFVAEPDLVVFTGDQVFHPTNPVAALNASLGPVQGTPYVFIFGNHDTGRCDKWNYHVMRKHVERRALLVGTSALRVNRADGDNLDLFFLDYDKGSHERSGSELPESHMAWFAEKSQSTDHSMVFLHVPPVEFSQVAIRSGQKQENVDHSRVSRLRVENLAKSVRVVAVGHDHVNDYCGDFNNVTLCYAGGAGYTTYGKEGWNRRARVYQFFSNYSLATYKLLDNVTGNLTMVDYEFL